MASNSKVVEGLAALRARAEALLAERSDGPGVALPEDMEQLFQELEIHQLELELQHEEVQRHQAEVEVLERRYRDLFEAAPFGYLTLDAAGRILSANATANAILGVPQDQLTGGSLASFVDPGSQDAFHLFRVSVPGAEAIVETRLTLQAPDGRCFPARLRATRVEGPEEALRLALLDLGAEEQRDRELEAARRLQVLGTLARGVAHDFNNLMGVILGNAELLQLECAEDGPGQLMLDHIRLAVERGRGLVKQLLSYSGKGKSRSRVPLDLHQPIQEALELLGSTLPKGIGLRFQEALAPCRVLVDPDAIRQVIMNLLLNAIQAMEDGGTLEVVLGHTSGDPPGPARVAAGTSKATVEILVRDTGPGMSPATLERVFDPFFSTKPMGTGLGLSVVQGIVRDHGGVVQIQSRPSGGSEFRVLLPAFVPPEEGARPAGPDGGGDDGACQARSEGPLRVLLVDDEPMALTTLTRLLENRGAQVAPFRDPRRALRTFEETPRDFDVLLTDLDMPEMDGVTLADRLRALRPGFAVVLLSGVGACGEFEALTTAGRVDMVLAKPVKANRLYQVLSDLVRGGPEDPTR